MSHPRTPVRLMLVVPWLIVGGADKVNLDLVRNLGPDYEITVVTTVPSPNDWADRFGGHAARIVHLPEASDAVPTAEALIALIEAHRIDCILLSNTREGYAALPQIRERYPVLPIYDLLHGQGGAHEGGGYPAISAPFDAFLTKRIVITDYLRDRMMREHGIGAHRLIRIHNGVDTVHFDPEGFSPPEPGPPVVTFIGRLSLEKRPEHLIAIARAIPEKTPCTVRIAGDGPLMGSLQEEVARRPAPHPIAFLGNVADVRPLLAETRVLVLTSEMEGLPIVLLEAMAMGVPVVASAVGGIPELVAHGRSGFLVPYDDDFAARAAAHVTAILGDAGARSRMGRQARRAVRDRFSVATMMAEYRRVLRPSGTGAVQAGGGGLAAHLHLLLRRLIG